MLSNHLILCHPLLLLHSTSPSIGVFPDESVGKESTCNAGDTGDVGLIPGSGRSPAEGNGNPLQYSSLGNPRDRGAWRATVHRVAKSWTWLSDWHTPHMLGHRLSLGMLDPPHSMGEGFSDVFRWTWNHSPLYVMEEAVLQSLWISYSPYELVVLLDASGPSWRHDGNPRG